MSSDSLDHVKSIYTILDALSVELAELTKLLSPDKRLNVPWLSQLGETAAFAPGDCGPACVAMVLSFLGKKVTVDEVSKATGMPSGFKLSSNQTLWKTAIKWDVTLYWARNLARQALVDEVDAGRPVICLVHYPSLVKKYDPKYPQCHFVVITGHTDSSVSYHDPYWRDSSGGAHIEIDNEAFDKAWSNVNQLGNSPRQCLRIKPK